jgi:hypothetical protein
VYQIENTIVYTAQICGVSVEEVRQEINEAILEAMERCKLEGNNIWSRVPCSGEVPTPEELLIYLIQSTGK